MALAYSDMLPLGTAAPDFDLPAANPEADGRGGARRTLADFADAEALVVVFTCNHCPYAQAVEDRLIALARDVDGVAVVAINPNDPTRYPDDSFEAMAARSRAHDYPFPYLFDETQAVARAYDAACTPDFYLFDGGADGARRLVYRGRLDDGRPGQEPTTHELRDAIGQLLATGEVTVEQVPSMGCSIKWREAV